MAYVNDIFKFSWSTATTFESRAGQLNCKNNFLIGAIQIRVVCKKKIKKNVLKNKKTQCQNVENFTQHIYRIKKPPEHRRQLLILNYKLLIYINYLTSVIEPISATSPMVTVILFIV